MLWYKGWLETRLRLIFTLAIMGFLINSTRTMHHAASLSGFLPFALPIMVVMPCVMLAGSGIATQPPFQATKGLHGSTLFTLSLPVARRHLLAVRATLGWLLMALAVTALSCGIWLFAPAFHSFVTPGAMLQYTATLIVCATSYYCLSVLFATFLDDQWRMWATLSVVLATSWLTRHATLPAFTDMFRAMGSGSPLVTHTTPWSAMVFSLVLSTTFLAGALKITQTREY